MRLGLSGLVGALLLAGSAAQASETITYTYDAQGRLVSAASTGTASGLAPSTATYSFDPAHNRKAEAISTANTASTLSIADPAAAVAGKAITFTVSRTGVLTQAVTVDYATANGSAQAGTDYTAATGRLSFAANASSQPIKIVTSAASLGGSFSVQLSAPSGTATLGRASATGTITPPAPSTFVAIGNAGPVTPGSALNFTVTRTGPLTGASSVAFTTVDGTAVAGVDYVSQSSTLTFAPNDSTKPIAISTLGGSAGNLSFTVQLSNVSAGTAIKTASGKGSIGPRGISASNPVHNFAEPPTTPFTFTTAALANIPAGHAAKIVSVSPVNGDSATIAVNGQSVVYTPPTQEPRCQGAYLETFYTNYVVQDTTTSTTASGSITANVTTQPTGGTCDAPNPVTDKPD